MDSPPAVDRQAFFQKRFGAALLLFGGVLLPAFTIGFELITRLCASWLFDPLPSLGHLAAVAAVPTINLRLWLMWRTAETPGRAWIFMGLCASAVAASYAVLFLPIYPVAAVAVLYAGMGLLPFAPLLAALAALGLSLGLARREPHPLGWQMAGGLIAGFVLMLALDAPTAITRIAVGSFGSPGSAGRERALRLMRNFGDRELLLRYCYDNSRRSGGLLAMLVANDRNAQLTPAAARELYYRLTGSPFNQVEPPYRRGSWAFVNDFEWDPDQGGAATGGRVHGLSLRNSRIDGSMDADDAVAYLEWTVEFSNVSPVMREARMTVALPPGAVVSRATLWVDEVEREAVFATRAQARAAYESVVRTNRDPLLVTTNGADQVFVQMFPVMPGQSARVRIGISAPLELGNDGRATLALPAIVDRNFTIDGSLHHAVWIEGQGREGPVDLGFTRTTDAGAVVRMRADFSDLDLSTRRPRVALRRNPQAQTVAAGQVVQSIRREPRAAAGPLMIVLDGSVGAKAAGAALLAAADGIPVGAQVGFALAGARAPQLPLAAWSPARKAELADLIGQAAFDGGEDNLGTLAIQLAALEGQRGTLLWIHGPQGFDFTEHTARLDQLLDRGSSLPRLELLPVAPGPNIVLQHPRLLRTAHTRAWSGDPRADIAAALADHFDASPRWTVTRTPGASNGLVTGSQHVEKLWARDEVEDLIAGEPGKLEQAMELARRYRLVTPVSGAVVLESDAQYRAMGLTPPDPSAVPTIPEPETWALLIIACLAFAWVAHARRVRSA